MLKKHYQAIAKVLKEHEIRCTKFHPLDASDRLFPSALAQEIGQVFVDYFENFDYSKFMDAIYGKEKK